MDGGDSFPKPINRLLHQRIKGGFWGILAYIFSTPKLEENSHHTKALKPRSLKTLKLSSKSRRIKKALFVLREILLQDQALTPLLKNFHQFKIKPRRPLKKVFIIHQLFVQDQASTALGSTTLHLHVSKIESEDKFVEEIVTPKSLIQILFCTRVLVSFIAGISVFTVMFVYARLCDYQTLDIYL
ncbi:hypothetical protein ACFX16_030404 [Malus domestica]